VSRKLARVLEKIEHAGATPALRKIRRGVEKESLRVDANGTLSQLPHPPGLGSPLTHPSITTDYSEALLEFITPVEGSVAGVLDQLEKTHRFAYQHLHQERLWVTSMPCIVHGDNSIPIARYGSSNIGQMKHFYRVGLSSRYGRLMQAIAGIHYNFSLSDDFWSHWQKIQGNTLPTASYRSECYLALVRNFYRHTWLVAYLFGASPAVCGSFVEGKKHQLEPLGQSSYHLPYATSLRMSDLGYRSTVQEQVNFSLDNLDGYVEALRKATETPHTPYKDIGVKVDNGYRQLNHNLLQLENEYYAPVRPKRVARSGEKPSHALRDRGIEYVEVRCLDLDPFSPVGIDQHTICFLDLLLLHCLFEDSAPLSKHGIREINHNLQKVVLEGRRPELKRLDDGSQTLAEEGGRLLDDLVALATLLDGTESTAYRDALRYQRSKFSNPENTPSARTLRMMEEHDGSFFKFAMAQSIEHEKFFRRSPLTPTDVVVFDTIAADSIARQKDIEASDQIGFDEFLGNYFAQ
jgi:glutamate--cysteine ligase